MVNSERTEIKMCTNSIELKKKRMKNVHRELNQIIKSVNFNETDIVVHRSDEKEVDFKLN